MTALDNLATSLRTVESLMDRFPGRSIAGDRAEEAADRAEEPKLRYLAKFSGIWTDIEVALVALNILAEYDTAAREAHNCLSDALADAKSIVKENA